MTPSFESTHSEQLEALPGYIEVLTADLEATDILHIKQLYAVVYGDTYVGDEVFEKSTLPNTSSVVMLKNGDQLVAAINLNVDRMIALAVSPEVSERGAILVKVLQQLTQTHRNLWATVGIGAKAMQATITNTQLNFKPVDSEEEIKELFRSIKGVPNPDSITTTHEELDFLNRRCGSDGEFTVMERPGSFHGLGYKQVVFINVNK